MDKQILFIGIGQMGCAVADLFSRGMREEGFSAHVLAVDTDERTLEEVLDAKRIPLTDRCRLGEVLDRMDAEVVKKWFPADREQDGVEFFECLSMHTGAGFWRMKAMLSFASFLSKESSLAELHAELDAVADTLSVSEAEDRCVRLYTVASLAGGTGSGLFVPFTLYVKRYLRERGIRSDSTALLALPDVCEELLTAEQRVKAEANAYAALRELNAMNASGSREDSAPIRIGGEEDPYLGLLFDSELPEYETAEGKPFGRVYLFRRVPGIRRVALHTELIADTVRTLCTEESDWKLNETDAIYGGVSLLRTVYSAESIERYIALRTLSSKADGEWTRLYEAAEREVRRMRAEVSARSKNNEESPAPYVDAVLSAAGMLNGNGESDCVLLARRFEDPKEDLTPAQRVPEGLSERIVERIDADFYDENAEALERFLADADANARTWKKERANMTFPSGKRRAQLQKDAERCGEQLKAYYKNGFEHLTNADAEFRARVAELLDPNASANGETSVGAMLLKPDGQYVHPVLALVRLCAFYRELEALVTPRTARQRLLFGTLSGKQIPEAMLRMDSEIRMDCKYADGGEERFIHLIEGVRNVAGGARNDEKLFAYDLEIALARIRDAFRFARGAVLLEELLCLITAYWSYLTELSSEGKELEIEVEAALGSYTGDNGITLCVGASAAQKKAAFEAYRAYLKEKELFAPYLFSQDALLGRCAYAAVSAGNGTGDSLEAALQLLLNQCRESGYFGERLTRNVVDVLLTESNPELALRKSLLARIPPLLYRIPEGPDAHLLHKSVVTHTTVILPAEAETYTAEHPELFDGATGVRAADKLLFRAGEYDGRARFSAGLPASCLTVLREITGMRLHYLEMLCEGSDEPTYYRSYQKALAMREAQTTELWNPHLLRGFCEGLPYIDPAMRDRKTIE